MRIQRPTISQPVITQPTITEVSSLEGDGANITGSFSGSFAGTLTGPTSASFATRISASEASLANLDDSYATDAQLNASSSTILSTVDSVSASLATSITSVDSSLTSVSGALATSIDGVSSDLTSVSGALANSITSTNSDLTALESLVSGVRAYTGSLKQAITVSGTDLTILGDLTVQGTQTAIDSATLNVADLNITVASGSANAAAANGAGLTVDGANATLTYASTGDKWVFNKVVDVPTDGLLINATAVTSTAAELNLLDGSSAGTVVNSKGVVYGASGEVNATTLQIGGVSLDNDLATFALPASTTISAFGATLVDDADAATARGTIGLTTTSDVQFDSFGVGTAASGTTGEIRATGDITAYYSSDERLKENFAPLTGALDKVKAIGGYEFDWKDGIEDVVSKTGHDIGVKAQELQAQYPELVHERDNGYLAVDYIKLNAVLIEAVKELAAKVEELSK